MTVTRALGGDDGVVSSQLDDAVIAGTAEPLQPLELRVTGPGIDRVLATLSPDADGEFSYALRGADFRALGQGSGYELTLTQTDAAGNTSMLSESFAIDTVAPAAPVIDVAGGDDQTISTVTGDSLISGRAEPGQTVTLFLRDVYGSEEELGSAIADADGIYSYTIASADLADLPQGSGLQLLARVSDSAGNVSVSESYTITVDTEAPEAPVISSGGGVDGVLTSVDGDGVISGTTEAYATVTVKAEDWSGATVELGEATGDSDGRVHHDAVAGNVVFPRPGSAPFLGSDHRWCGNTTVSSEFSATIDTIAESSPEVSAVGGIDGVISSQAGDRTIRGQAEAGRAVLLSVEVPARGRAAGYRLDLGSVTPAADGEYALVLTDDQLRNLGEGTGYQLFAEQADVVGNIGRSVAFDFAIDTVSPTAPVLTSVGGIDLTISSVSGDAEVLGRAFANADVVLSGSNDGENYFPIATVMADGTGEFSYALTQAEVDAFEQGSNLYVKATVTDAAGNSASSEPFRFSVDTVAPVMTVTRALGGDDGVVSSQLDDAVIAGTAEPLQPLELRVTGPGIDRVLATLSPDADGEFSCTLRGADFRALGQGSGYELTLTQTDAAGNTSMLSESFAIDTVAPAAPVIDVAGGDDQTISTVTGDSLISGRAEPGQTVTLFLRDVYGSEEELGSAIADADGIYSYTIASADLADLPQGSGLQLLARVSDSAGNVSVSESYTITVDTEAPEAPVISSGGGVDGVLTSVDGDGVISGTTEAYATVTVKAEDWSGATVELGEATGDSDGRFTTTLSQATLSSLGQGLRRFWAQITDGAGNTTVSSEFSATIDTIAESSPEVSAVGGIDGVISSQAGDRTIRGQAEAGRAVLLSVEVPARGRAAGYRLDLGSVTPAADGEYALVLTDDQLRNLGEGTGYQLFAEQADVVGNIGRSVAFDFAIDTVSPTAPVLTSVGGIDLTISSVSGDAEVLGRAFANADVVLSGSNDGENYFPIATVMADGTGEFSYALTQAEVDAFEQGSNLYVKATVTDAAGNSASSEPFRFSVETLPPVSPTFSNLALVNGIESLILDSSAATNDLVVNGFAPGANRVELTIAGTTLTTLADVNTSGEWSLRISAEHLPASQVQRQETISAVAINRHDARSDAMTKQLLVDTIAPSIAEMIQDRNTVRFVFTEVVSIPEELEATKLKVRSGTRSIDILSLEATVNSSGTTELVAELAEEPGFDKSLKVTYSGTAIHDSLANLLAQFTNQPVTTLISDQSISGLHYTYRDVILSGEQAPDSEMVIGDENKSLAEIATDLDVPLELLAQANPGLELDVQLSNGTKVFVPGPSVVGNDYSNIITGNDHNNVLIGGRGRDVLTGAEGRDTFAYQSLSESLLWDSYSSSLAHDIITDLEVGTDVIDAPQAVMPSDILRISTTMLVRLVVISLLII